MTTDTVQIAAPEAEAAVIGACLADSDAIIFVAPEVHPNDFSVPVMRWAADAIWKCFERKIPPTMGAVIDRLRSAGKWSDTPSRSSVTMQDIDACLSATSQADVDHAVSNARLVRDCAFRRSGFFEVSSAAKLFNDRTMTSLDIQRCVMNKVGHVFDGYGKRDSALDVIGCEERNRIAAMSDTDLPGVSCGIAWLDDLTGGFLPAEAWVIAAPYKMRKTTLALNMVLSIASASVPVSVFTVGDSSRDSTYRKLLAMQMNKLMIADKEIAHQVISSKTLQYKMRDTYYIELRKRAEAVLDVYPVRLYDGRDMVSNLNETGRILRRDVAMYGTRIFIYDYAQAANCGQNDYERTSNIAGWTQQIIGELGITGIVISQLNETTIKTSDNESYSPGAKGGGALPAMANVFLSTRYAEPLITIELKLARDTRMGDKMVHHLNPPSGLILDAAPVKGT